MTPPREFPAAHLRPDDLLRRGGALFVTLRIKVSPDMVEIEAARIEDGEIVGYETIQLSPDEITHVLAGQMPGVPASAGAIAQPGTTSLSGSPA